MPNKINSQAQELRLNVNMTDATQYKNGTNVQFDYSHEPNNHSILNIDPGSASSASKKKKKKKKKKSKSANDDPHTEEQHPTEESMFSIDDARIHDPEADYPTSRVIKVGPSGDLVVESLDDEYPQAEEAPAPNYPDQQSRELLDFSLFHFHSDDEREFWANLPDEDKRDILRVDKEHLMENLRNLRRNNPNKSMPFNQYGTGDHHTQDNDQCSCAYCGRNSRYIEDEIAIAYSQHLDVIANYLESCMNARAEFPRNISEPRFYPGISYHDQHPMDLSAEGASPSIPATSHPENVLAPYPPVSYEEISTQEAPEPYHDEEAENDHPNADEKLLMNLEPQEMLDILGKAKKVLELINPSTIQELVKYELLKRKIKPEAAIDESAKNLTEIFANIKKDDANGLAKAVEFIRCCSRLYKESNDQFNDVLQFLSNFADLIMKNDGKSFVDMLESLTDARNARMNLVDSKIQQIQEGGSDTAQEQVLQSPLNLTDTAENEMDFPVPESELAYNTNHEEDYHGQYDGEEHEGHEDGHEYVCDHECSHGQECDHECHHDEYDQDDDLDDDDSHQGYDDGDLDDEEAQRGRSQEIRGFVMIQAVNMIRERFMEAYERKLSEDRTQKFIAELEAEENAKKEREAKKLKAKEKQKEKKRLQQLAKEEEKKRKEAEESARKEEAERKQEAIRAMQLKKKEEARLKREEEKRKRIEALQKKELEQQQAADRKRKQQEDLKRENEKKQEEKRALERKKLAEKKQEQKLSDEKRLKEKRLGEARLEEKRLEEKRAEERRQEERKAELRNLEQRRTSTRDVGDTNSAAPLLSQAPMGNDNINETEDFLNKQQQELLEKANSLSLDSNNPLMPLDELKMHSEVPTASPPRNHLLEQLYRAKPQSLSSTTASTPHGKAAELNHFGLPEQAPQYVSPNKSSEFNPQLDGFRAMEWRNSNSAFPNHQSQQGMSGNQNTQFSPFNSHAVLDQLQQPPSVDVFVGSSIGSNTRPSVQQSNSFLWSNNASRNNSIWNPSNAETPHGIWNNNTTPQPLNNGMLPVGPRFSLSDQKPMVDAEAIQKAAFDAYTLMLANNQLSFDLAPVNNMFQVVKGLSGNSTMGMSEFLNTLKVPGRYHFDLVHDDRGNATHIKVTQNHANGSHSQVPAPMGQQGMPQPLNTPLQFGLPNPSLGPFQGQPFHQNLPSMPQQPSTKPVNSVPPKQHEESDSLNTNSFQLPGSIPGLLNHMGFGQGGSIW